MSDVEEDRWLSQEWCKTGAEAEACPLEGMGSSQLDVLNHRGPPKVGGMSNTNDGREGGGAGGEVGGDRAGDGSPGGCARAWGWLSPEGVWREGCVCACERERVCLGCVRVLLFCV